MAINIVLRVIISIFAIGIATIAFFPAVYDLYYMQDLWDTAPAEALAVRDNVYATFLSLPLFMIGAVFLWAYMATSKRDNSY